MQAQILNLLLDLQEQLALAILFVSHDLRWCAISRTASPMMYLGRVVELGPAESVFHEPRHPYTQALLRAAPTMEPPPDGVRPSAGERGADCRARWPYRPAARSIRAALSHVRSARGTCREFT